MEALKNKKHIQPIAGFKVMQWVRSVRDREYQLDKENPQEYLRQLKIAGKRMRERACETLNK